MREGFEYVSARSVLSPARMDELTRFVDGGDGVRLHNGKVYPLRI